MSHKQKFKLKPKPFETKPKPEMKIGFTLLCIASATSARSLTGSLRTATSEQVEQGLDRPGEWVHCANQGGECARMPQDKQVWVRYSNSQGRIFYKRAFQKALCTDGYFGVQPDANTDKACSFYN
uniref:Uncharacterized protein n=1 Tax=Mucochytrium quahogii TaxID=96639 RepID=A0A7S2SM03_9STRA|mmetsp:Transcript_8036/g.17643  ORF Transcript_8036/g.17643 Transcript_8036/m.17643 type:complete len:125 (+) Transcript_8036:38-412(+)